MERGLKTLDNRHLRHNKGRLFAEFLRKFRGLKAPFWWLTLGLVLDFRENSMHCCILLAAKAVVRMVFSTMGMMN